MLVRMYLSPVDKPLCELTLVERVRLVDLFPTEEDQLTLAEEGLIALDGEVIPPDRWPMITLKPDNNSALDFIHVPGSKKTLAIIAAVAAVALTAGIAAFGVPFLGIAAGSLGSALLSAGVGVAASLAINALTAPPKVSNAGEEKSVNNAGISNNQISLLEPLPVIFGEIVYSPPPLAPAYTYWDGDDVYVRASVGVQGRCAISDVRVNGIPIEDYSGASYETREGAGTDSPRTTMTQTVVEERDGVVLSNFKTELTLNSNDLLTDQADPTSASPQWHPFRTAGSFDKAVLRFMFPNGIVYTSTGAEAFVPLRIRMRKVGSSTWRNLPTFHIYDKDKGAGPMRAEISIERIKQPSGWHFCSAFEEYPIFDVVDRTAFGQSFQFNADDYFLGPAMDAATAFEMTRTIPLLTGYTGSGYTVSASSEFSTSYRAWYCMDAASFGGATQWRPANNSLPAWHMVQCPSPKTFRCYNIWGASSSSASVTTDPQTWMPQGSNDGTNWVDLDDYDVDVSDQLIRGGTYQIGNPGSYLYYRILFKSNRGAASQQLQVSYLNWYEEDAPGLALSYNDNGASSTGHGLPAIHSGGSPYEYARCRYVSLNKKGARVFLDPDQWEEGEYEIQVKRGVAAYYSFYESTSVSGTGSPYVYNGSATNADYFDYRLTSGQYKIFVGQRLYRSDMQVEVFQTISDESPFDDTGIAMISVDVPNIQLQSISAKFSRYANIYDGTIWKDEEQVTSNPAALYRQLLLGVAHHKPAPSEAIDEEGLAQWYEDCVTKGYEVNAVLQSSRVGEAKQMIATAGYASVTEGELYGVVQDKDTTSDPIRYLVSPSNSKDEGNSNDLPDMPHGLRAEFNNEDLNYAIDHVIVYMDGYSAENATVFETVNYAGFTNQAKVEARALFDLRQRHMRQTLYQRRVGMEFIGLKRGNPVALADDTVDDAVAYGRIVSVQRSGTDVVSITLDNVVAVLDGSVTAIDDITSLTDVLDLSSAMGVAIRVPGSNIVEKQISNVTDTNVMTFSTPFADDDIVPELVVAIGRWGRIVRRCKLLYAIPQGYEQRTLILVDEAPELYA